MEDSALAPDHGDIVPVLLLNVVPLHVEHVELLVLVELVALLPRSAVLTDSRVPAPLSGHS